MALSVLASFLLESIHEVRYKNPYSGKKLKIFDENGEGQLMKDNIHPENIAYKIFKPVNDKLVSKAEVAQCLAIKINQIVDNENIKESRDKVMEDIN